MYLKKMAPGVMDDAGESGMDAACSILNKTNRVSDNHKTSVLHGSFTIQHPSRNQSHYL
jgi:hypothetical protein